jgi:hypothetical protein
VYVIVCNTYGAIVAYGLNWGKSLPGDRINQLYYGNCRFLTSLTNRSTHPSEIMSFKNPHSVSEKGFSAGADDYGKRYVKQNLYQRNVN